MESIKSIYAELAEATRFGSARSSYDRFHKVFTEALDLLTKDTGVTLNGLYARINYLSKQHKVDFAIDRAINSARQRLKDLEHGIGNGTLMRCKMEDFRAICEFIEAVSGVAVPEHIREMYPPRAQTKGPRRYETDCMRITVNEWDADCISGTNDKVGEVRVGYENDSWKYIKEYLSKGSQLNLIRPKLKDGIYYPELIIYEPDFLVDVSSIAGCFTNYACHPVVQLLNKIKPQTNSEAIMLGFLAGQLLDEELHVGKVGTDYDASYERFIQSNPFNALTTDIPNLKDNGAQQQENIHKILEQTMPAAVSGYDRRNIIVEPTFFCEMLGMNGRMDMLQMDYKVLVEQKSGKGGFPELIPGVKPTHKQDNYAQLLLYRAILHYGFGVDNNDIRSFLLYSKYEEGLLELGQAPLLHYAIMLRNGLAWYERRYCAGYIKVLDYYAKYPERLNMLQCDNRLWNDYQLPAFRSLLAPLNSASPLEKAYFYRFMTFLEMENMISKVGDKEKDSTGFASKWRDSLETKKASGSICDGLDIRITAGGGNGITADGGNGITADGGAISSVDLMPTDEISADSTNFRKGDIVILYPYTPGEEPDVRKSMAFRGTLTEIAVDHLTVELRAPQTDSRVFDYHKGKMWAVEHDSLDSSTNSLYRGMYSFLSAPASRRDLLLLQRMPDSDQSKKLRGDYGPFNELALRVKQANDMFLIIGPPGTGKTSYGMLNTVKEELLELEANGSEEAVLIMAYTNRAVDEICSKLVEAGIDFLRLGHVHSCDPAYRDHLLDSRLSGITDIEKMRGIVCGARVIVGTTSSLNGHMPIFTLKTFSLAVIDEASQILEPQLIGLLSAKNAGDSPAIRKFVMIGDHKQLPAVVQQAADVSMVNEPELNAIYLENCRLSMFERLLRKYRLDPAVTYMLTSQGRMHHDIADFPNRAFYEGMLDEVPLPHQREALTPWAESCVDMDRLLDSRRTIFIPVHDPDENAASDKVNLSEARVIAEAVFRIYLREQQNFDRSKTVGVIVPYRNQIAAIRKCIDEYGHQELHDITIDTVERFQGSQRDWIIYGFTAKYGYQLKFLTGNRFEENGHLIDRKLNVALTRARKHMIVVGDPELMKQDPLFCNFMGGPRNYNNF